MTPSAAQRNPFLYSGIDDPSRWVLPAVLDEQAARRPDAPWIECVDGETLSFGQAGIDMRRAAGWFAAQGIGRGDHVALMMFNGTDFIRAWLGLLSLGAVAVLLNTELRGGFLRHQLVDSGATLAVIDATLADAVTEVLPEVPSLRRVAVTTVASPSSAAADAARAAGARWFDWAGWRRAPELACSPPLAQDIASIMYTSGTSGPAKGVLMPHAHCTLYGVGAIRACALGADDRYYIVLPLFHANGLLMQLAATLLAGIPAILRTRFSASAWLADIREHRATVTNCLGALSAFVVAQPPTARDREHGLRVLLNAPNAAAHETVFRERFGVPEVISGFGMTEVNIPIWGRVGRSAPGAAGWVHEDHFEVIIAHPDSDRELPRGEVGEILVRPRVPFGFMAGYHQLPDRTVEAWRNLWFHTGDAGTMGPDGLVTFVDRIKDCIRRRGENISATEVERLLEALPGVGEIAAYAVPSDLVGGEDELMLAIVAAPGTTPSLPDIAQAADALLPRFARPRYLQLLEALPKTATGKVQRAMLRKRGVGDAWDRDRPRGE